MLERKCDLRKLKTIVFDVSGTLFQEDKEYISGCGSLNDNFNFLRFYVWDLVKKRGWDAYNAARWTMKKYKELKEREDLKNYLARIDEQVKEEYNWALEKYLNDDILCACEFGVRDHSFFYDQMINYIDFKKILVPDLKLYALMDGLKEKGFSLGILSSESFVVIQKIFEALGLSLSWFFMDTKEKYPIFCAESICKKDFLSKNYKRLKKTCLSQNDDAQTLLYVGDHLKRDVEAPLGEGFQVVHVLNQNAKKKIDKMRIEACVFEYFALQNIYEMGELLEI